MGAAVSGGREGADESIVLLVEKECLATGNIA
jgi:hypothetical protein